MNIFASLKKLGDAMEETYGKHDSRNLIEEVTHELEDGYAFSAYEVLTRINDEAGIEIDRYTQIMADDIEEAETPEEAKKNEEYWTEHINEYRLIMQAVVDCKASVRAIEDLL